MPWSPSERTWGDSPWPGKVTWRTSPKCVFLRGKSLVKKNHHNSCFFGHVHPFSIAIASYMLVHWRVIRWTYCLASLCGLVVPPHLLTCFLRLVTQRLGVFRAETVHWHSSRNIDICIGWERFVQTHAFGIWMLLDHGWTCGAVTFRILSPKLISIPWPAQSQITLW